MSFNVWVKPSNPSDEEDTASSSSSSSKTDDDLLRVRYPNCVRTAFTRRLFYLAHLHRRSLQRRPSHQSRWSCPPIVSHTMWLRWLLEGRQSKPGLTHLLQCDEEIDEDSISISSKRPVSSPYLEHRPAKRMRATTLPTIKVPSSFLSFAHHLLCSIEGAGAMAQLRTPVSRMLLVAESAPQRCSADVKLCVVGLPRHSIQTS